MDKTVIFAVAGSGKTTHIIERLNLTDRSLVLTYTNNNQKNLQKGIIEKFSYFPENITLYTYFSFLYSFCFRPFLSLKYKTNGINYKPNTMQYIKQNDILKYFFDGGKRLYGNRIAKLLEVENIYCEIIFRLEKYYDNLYIDEIQDFAGHDFNFLEQISSSKINMLFVGDFFQHTFDTSRDGQVNANLHSDFGRYKKRFINMGIKIDETTLNKSFRCSKSVCEFVKKEIGIEIKSCKQNDSQITLINDQSKADSLFCNKEVIKLFYQTHYKFSCFSKNWGDSKGENSYFDVCIVLNKTTMEHFEDLFNLPDQTKNKLYVACTRANNDLYFVPEGMYKKYKK